jgi:beta-fructofuranosidase
VEEEMEQKRKMRPVLDGDFWLIGPNPADLDLPHLVEQVPRPDTPEGAPVHECVDHHIFQSADGAWHLWGCIRKTTVGRILYHWEGESLTHGPWRQTGEILRANHDAGESLDDWRGEEWMQSPFVVSEGGRYFMFCGAHGTAADGRGDPVPHGDLRMACQMCLMTSDDGRQWTRYRNPAGQSRVFVGPGETRDPCLLRVDGLWYLYHAGYHDHDPKQAGFYVRTSRNLIHWSDWRLVHQDPDFGAGRWHTECPHVVYRGGYYYLFRTADYVRAETYVFRSENPCDFGVGDASDKYVGRIAVAAPEIVVDSEGNEFITSNHDLFGGTRLCRLRWVDMN